MSRSVLNLVSSMPSTFLSSFLRTKWKTHNFIKTSPPPPPLRPENSKWNQGLALWWVRQERVRNSYYISEYHIILQLELFLFFNYGPLKLIKRPPWARSYKGGYLFFDKNNLPSPWATSLTTPYVFSLLLGPFFIQCKGPQCQPMWLVQLPNVCMKI